MASYQILAFAASFLILLPIAVNGDLGDLSPALSPFYGTFLTLSCFICDTNYWKSSAWNTIFVWFRKTDRLCDDVDCGKGTCKANISYPLNYICECDAGWKRTQDDSDDDDDHKFLPCVIPNCKQAMLCLDHGRLYYSTSCSLIEQVSIVSCCRHSWLLLSTSSSSSTSARSPSQFIFFWS